MTPAAAAGYRYGPMTVTFLRQGCAPPAIIDVPTPPPKADRLLYAFAVLGVALRFAVYFRNPSLWGDEAMLALNVLHKSPAELLGPLDDNQGAPVGYLMLLKLLTGLFGGSEFVLRLPSLLAAVGGMFCFVIAAMNELTRPAARWAVLLFATSPWLVAYAAEAKQYELDAAIAIALIAARHRPVLLGVLGTVAVWFSHPAAFVLAGVGLPLLLTTRGRFIVAACAASFAANYIFVLRRLGDNPYLREYWAGQFCPLVPDVGWLIEHAVSLFADAGGFGLTAAVAILCAWRARDGSPRMNAAVTRALVPILVALLASAAGQYPFAGRLLLFAVPGLLLLVAAGLEKLPRAAAVILLAGPLLELGQLFDRPLHAEDARAAAAFVLKNRGVGEPVFVTATARPGFRYYGRGVSNVAFGPDVRTDLPRYRDLLAGRTGFVVMTHFRPEEEAAVKLCFGGREVYRGADAVVFRK